MMTSRIRRAWTLPLLTGVVLTTIAGCGDDTGLGKRYPVTGTVSYGGKPVENGQITFEPVSNEGANRPANGVIKNGSYKLTTALPDDGALPGDYLVKIAAKDVDDSKVTETIAQKGGGGRQVDVGKALKAAKNLIPAKYQLTDTSGLKRTVEAKSNTFNFDLTD